MVRQCAKIHGLVQRGTVHCLQVGKGQMQQLPSRHAFVVEG